MAQYVDIMTDAGFKAVFQDKQVTIKFLNAALAGERQIKDITYLDKEIKPETVENRTIIFDLLCEDVSGAKFILEMQNCPQHYFFNRGFYYLCRMVARQGQIGKQWQYRLLPIYGVYFLNFKLPEFTDFRTDVVLANERTGKVFNEIKMKQIYISFPLFSLSKEECKSSFERWIYTLKNMNLFEQSPFKEEQETFLRLLDVANVNSLSEKERAIYEENLKNYRDWYATIDYAQTEGIEKGMQKGIEKGRQEEKLQIARKMKEQGLDSELIAQCSGLSVEDYNPNQPIRFNSIRAASIHYPEETARITFVHSRYLESVIKIQRNKETDDCSAPHPLLLALDRIGDLLFISPIQQ